MGKLAAYLKDDGNNFIFTGIKAECYIPEHYNNGKLFEQSPDSVTVFGLFTVKVFDGNDKVLCEEILNIPTMIYMYPADIIEDEVTLESDIGDGGDRYIILRFFTGDIFTPVNIIQNLDNTELFLNLLCGGKLPRIKYSDIINVWHKNLALNGTNVGVTSSIQEAIIREIYRDPKKPERTFGEARSKDNGISDYDYRAASLREICARNSTFAAMTFEDIDSMITYSLNTTAYNKKEKISPVEEIIKM